MISTSAAHAARGEVVVAAAGADARGELGGQRGDVSVADTQQLTEQDPLAFGGVRAEPGLALQQAGEVPGDAHRVLQVRRAPRR